MSLFWTFLSQVSANGWLSMLNDNFDITETNPLRLVSNSILKTLGNKNHFGSKARARFSKIRLVYNCQKLTGAPTDSWWLLETATSSKAVRRLADGRPFEVRIHGDSGSATVGREGSVEVRNWNDFLFFRTNLGRWNNLRCAKMIVRYLWAFVVWANCSLTTINSMIYLSHHQLWL